MVAVEKFGSNFMGALSYNLKKLNHPEKAQRGELLATSFSSLSPAMIKKEVALIRELRPALSKYVWHTSLNFSNQESPEKLTSEKLLAIALDYMTGMGYDDNQYLIVKHNDADHPHVHMLVNRIKYDGGLVSDSNNYHKSQALLRRLEDQYHLITLDRNKIVTKYRNTDISSDQKINKPGDQPNNLTSGLGNQGTDQQRSGVTEDPVKLASQRALTKDEIEKTIRTGIPSDKSVLQAILNPIISTPGITLQQFIDKCEKHNINLLFNQASTGRVSGITYFINDFKIKGQALGNRFKWAELIKHIDYEQDRDSETVSQANDRTIAKYGERSQGTEFTTTIPNPGTGIGVVPENTGGNTPQFGEPEDKAGNDAKRPMETDQDVNFPVHGAANPKFNGFGILYGIQISDDEDDSRYRKRKRRR